MKESGFFVWVRSLHWFWASLIIVFLICDSCIGATTPVPMAFDKESVQFIFRKQSPTNYAPFGTCFLVDCTTERHSTLFHRLPIPILMFFTYKGPITQHTRYFVTARHVLFDQAGKLWPDLYWRVDNEKGGVSYLYLNSDLAGPAVRIITPNDPSIDLAVFTVSEAAHSMITNHAGTEEKIKLGWFDATLVSNDKMLKKYKIREGTDMFFVGLFTPFYGAQRNFPIFRFGRVSMLPDEPINLGEGKSRRLYLMETQAFGGNSGSPAFFSFAQGYFGRRNSEITSGHPLFSDSDRTKILFAGVVNAYFPDYEQVKLQNVAAVPVSQGNTGIATIVPASYLYEILYSQKEKEYRDALWKQFVPPGYK